MIQQKRIKNVIPAALCLFSAALQAGPWFTGPLLAGSGHTIPAGHVNFEPYFFNIKNIGSYDANGHFQRMPGFQNIIGNPVFSVGITDWMDVQYSIPYLSNKDEHGSNTHIGDVTAGLGLQLLEQKEARYRPDIRLAFKEVIPTGKFTKLHDTFDANDATGSGDYQSGVSLNMQQVLPIFTTHYLRTRLNIGYVYSHYLHITGPTVYGGNDTTDGTISPGNQFSIDIAQEFSLNQNWALVMEAYHANRGSSIFFGFPGFGANAVPANLSTGHTIATSLAPAIEYSINANVGIIAGYWFTVAGRQALRSNAAVVAINFFV